MEKKKKPRLTKRVQTKQKRDAVQTDCGVWPSLSLRKLTNLGFAGLAFCFSSPCTFPVTNTAMTASAIITCLLKTFLDSVVRQAQRKGGETLAQRGCCGGMLQRSHRDQNWDNATNRL